MKSLGFVIIAWMIGAFTADCQTTFRIGNFDHNSGGTLPAGYYPVSSYVFKSADDFSVPNTLSNFTIEKVMIRGKYNNAAVKGTVAGWNVEFFTDQSLALPVDSFYLVYNLTAQEPVDGTPILTLPAPLTLAPGKYWISVYPTFKAGNNFQTGIYRWDFYQRNTSFSGNEVIDFSPWAVTENQTLIFTTDVPPNSWVTSEIDPTWTGTHDIMFEIAGTCIDTTPPTIVGVASVESSDDYVVPLLLYINDDSRFDSGTLRVLKPNGDLYTTLFGVSALYIGNYQVGRYLVNVTVPNSPESNGTWSIQNITLSDFAGNSQTVIASSFGSPKWDVTYVPPPPVTTVTTGSRSPSKGSDNSTVIIIAVVVSVVAVAAIVAILLFLYKRRHSSYVLQQTPSNNVSPNQTELSVLPSMNIMKRLKNISIEGKLGGGNFGDVYKGTWQNNPVALKKLKTPEQFTEFEREAFMLQNLSHPNIVQFFGVYISENNLSYLVTEFLDKGNLTQLFAECRNEGKTFDTAELLEMTLDAAQGMAYLRDQQILHRDLALRNLLCKQNSNSERKLQYVVKVSDFGMSKILDDTGYYKSTKNDVAIPIKWSAPEVLEFNKASFESDVWSFGVVMWEIFSGGRVPMASYNNQEAFEAILDGKIMEQPKNCPDEVYNWMKACWSQTPKSRPSFSQIVEGISAIHDSYVAVDKIQSKPPTVTPKTNPSDVEEFYTVPDKS